MKNVTIVLAVAAVLALASPAWADTHVWNDDDLGDNNWSTPDNWDLDEVPAGSDTALIKDNETTCYIKNIGAGSSSMHVYVGDGAASTGQLVIDGSGITDMYLNTKYMKVYEGGTVTHNGGVHRLNYNGMLVYAGGVYNLYGGKLDGVAGNTSGKISIQGEFNQTAGHLYSKGREVLIDTGGEYNLSGGKMEVGLKAFTIKGTLNISGSPEIIIYKKVTFDAGSKLTAGSSHTFLMTGRNHGTYGYVASFENNSTDETATGLAGLNDITLKFKYGSSRPLTAGPGTLEVGGKDDDAVMGGLTLNFALEGLNVGEDGDTDIQLVDLVDNGNRSSPEALYVENLYIDAGSTIDLNGLNLYYLNGEDPGVYTGDGRVIDSAGGGGIYQIPEPATLALLALGGIGVLLRRRK